MGTKLLPVSPMGQLIALDKLRDNQGQFLTQSLFVEKNRNPDKYPPIFTLKEHDHDGFISLRRKYLEAADPTEHSFAKKNFGSWDHWQRLRRCTWFQEYITEWEKELEAVIVSDVYTGMKDIAKDKNASGRVAALEWIGDKPWKEKVPVVTKRGRPTQAEVESKLKEALREKEEFSDDAKRLGIGDK